MRSFLRLYRVVFPIILLAFVGGGTGAIVAAGVPAGSKVRRGDPTRLQRWLCRAGFAAGALIGLVVAASRRDDRRGAGGPAAVSNQSLQLERALRSRDEFPGVVVRVYSAHREKWRRVLVVQGAAEGEIEYAVTNWGPRVSVNGDKFAPTRTFDWVLFDNLRVDFQLSGQGLTLPARVEAEPRAAGTPS